MVINKKKVIVTGASGFIGRYLIPILLKNNYEVVAISRDSTKCKTLDWYPYVNFYSIDISKEIKNLEIEPNTSLIHLSWDKLPNYNDLFHIEENFPNNYKFIKYLVSKGVNQVLVTGTCFEYGKQSGPIESSTICNPDNAYGLAKHMLNKSIKCLRKEQNFCFQWARLFYMYGKGQNKKSLLSKLDKDIDNQKEFFNMTEGEQLRDYLKVETVAKQLYKLFIMKKEGDFNICSGKAISVRKLVEKRIKERNSNIQLKLGYYPYSDYESMAFWGIKDIL